MSKGQPAALVKARIVGTEADGQRSNVAAVEENDKRSQLFGKIGALPPPYDPTRLALIFENSSALSKNIDAYVTNIDGFGHRFVPTIDLQAVDADDRIRDALRMERAKDSLLLDKLPEEPTDAEVQARKKKLDVEMRLERAKLEIFFDACTADLPFSGPGGLRGITRKDVEVIGRGYWEVLRGQGSKVPSQFLHVPPHTIRLMPEDEEFTTCEQWVRTSLLSVEKRVVQKRFRRYVQVFDNSTKKTFFKEFGDPRVMSADTGKFYASKEELIAKETKKDKDKPAPRVATELWEPIRQYNIRSPYGIPRWISVLLEVLGSREAGEVNFLYFQNKSVPPMAITVNGGSLTEETITRLEDHIENTIKGKANFHKLLILESAGGDDTTGGTGSKVQIKLQPLTDAQQKDALFQDYDRRNDDKIGEVYRLPGLLRGAVKDLNRATAEAALDFAELQVFGPLREEFDWAINKFILPEIGVKYHRFVSLAPQVRDPQGLADIITKFAKEGVLTPGEARELSAAVFGKDLQKIRAYWTEQPLQLTLAGRVVGDNLATSSDEGTMFGADFSGQGAAAGTSNAIQAAGGSAQAVAKALEKIVKHLQKQEREEYERRLSCDHDHDAEYIKVPPDVWKTFFPER